MSCFNFPCCSSLRIPSSKSFCRYRSCSRFFILNSTALLGETCAVELFPMARNGDLGVLLVFTSLRDLAKATAAPLNASDKDSLRGLFDIAPENAGILGGVS